MDNVPWNLLFVAFILAIVLLRKCGACITRMVFLAAAVGVCSAVILHALLGAGVIVYLRDAPVSPPGDL